MNAYNFIHWDDLDVESQLTLSTSPLLKKINNHYFRNVHSQSYYREYLGDDNRNRTIIVRRRETPILALTRLCKANEINFAGQPSEIISVVDKIESRMATVEMISHLKKMSKNVRLSGAINNNSIVIKELAAFITSINHSYHGYVDLRLPRESYKKVLRKSYKSLINWGEKNFSIRLADQNATDLSEFKAFQNLHLRASGKSTRSEATWSKQFDTISAGFGFLINAYYNDKIVGGCYIMNDQKQAFYAVAAGNRDLMGQNIPVNHFPLYHAIRHCQNLGLTKFNFGNVSTDQTDSKKLKNINQFKRGFCTDISIRHSINFSFWQNTQ